MLEIGAVAIGFALLSKLPRLSLAFLCHTPPEGFHHSGHGEDAAQVPDEKAALWIVKDGVLHGRQQEVFQVRRRCVKERVNRPPPPPTPTKKSLLL